MTDIALNIDNILNQIRHFESLYQRPAGSVSLLAVSKRHSSEIIRAAAAHGIRDFGENYVQEGVEKIENLKELALIWHFIGPIQSNKTKAIAENFDWAHSIERAKIAERLSRQRPVELCPLNVCIQINLSQEATKSGTHLESAKELCQVVDRLPGLTLRGLMAIPAPNQDPQQQRACFRDLATEFNVLCGHYPSMDTLSMGMSNDFEAAIAEGSTMIRIGTALFGRRPG
ncbi:MAG: YggS family pyridoxal phosphate-dependent enzyme [Pseudohongiellaceae bacterium]